ncbi:MAG: hypothetical protein IT384_04485 [Deltaproteobacteria bacterium]|nr:hypothetical protein [Deltaproteobacteria bacterium]
MQLALSRLQTLGLPVFLAEGAVGGRLRIDPKRLRPLEGVEIERLQTFIVTPGNRISFPHPSPLHAIGEIDILDLASESALLVRIELAWQRHASSVEAALAAARGFSKTARIVPDGSIESTVSDGDVELVLRFSADGKRAKVIGVGGRRLEESGFGKIDEIELLGDRGVAVATLRRMRRRVQELLGVVEEEQPDTDTWEQVDLDEGVEAEVVRAQSTAPPEQGPGEAAPKIDSLPILEPDPEPLVTPDLPSYGEEAAADPLPATIGAYDDPFADPVKRVATPLSTGDLKEVARDSLPPPRGAPTPTPALAPPRQDRWPRLEVDFPVLVIAGGQAHPARLVNINAGGAFIGIALDLVPPVHGMIEVVAASGPPIRARVAHRRDRAAAARLGSPEGIGVQFVPDRTVQTAPGLSEVLIWLEDPGARRRVSEMIDAEGGEAIMVSDLINACLTFLAHRISLVIVDAALNSGDWVLAAEALGLHRRGVPVLVLESEYRPRAPFPGWAARTNPSMLSPRLIQIALGANEPS